MLRSARGYPTLVLCGSVSLGNGGRCYYYISVGKLLQLLFSVLVSSSLQRPVKASGIVNCCMKHLTRPGSSIWKYYLSFAFKITPISAPAWPGVNSTGLSRTPIDPNRLRSVLENVFKLVPNRVHQNVCGEEGGVNIFFLFKVNLCFFLPSALHLRCGRRKCRTVDIVGFNGQPTNPNNIQPGVSWDSLWEQASITSNFH